MSELMTFPEYAMCMVVGVIFALYVCMNVGLIQAGPVYDD